MNEMYWIVDPGHAWLKVRQSEVLKHGIKPSTFSLMDSEYFYLEEDCDAFEYLERANIEGANIPEEVISSFVRYCWAADIGYIHEDAI